MVFDNIYFMKLYAAFSYNNGIPAPEFMTLKCKSRWLCHQMVGLSVPMQHPNKPLLIHSKILKKKSIKFGQDCLTALAFIFPWIQLKSIKKALGLIILKPGDSLEFYRYTVLENPYSKARSKSNVRSRTPCSLHPACIFSFTWVATF
jgi:hypothetical protein